MCGSSVEGLPYEKVSYDANLQQAVHDYNTDVFIKSILSVSDEDGNLLFLKGLPLEFELNINEMLFIRCRPLTSCREFSQENLKFELQIN